MRVFLATAMGRAATAALTAFAIGAAAMAFPAAAADITVTPNATPVPRLARGQDVSVGYSIRVDEYPPACPYRYFYACRVDFTGIPQCACWPGIGFGVFGIY